MDQHEGAAAQGGGRAALPTSGALTEQTSAVEGRGAADGPTIMGVGRTQATIMGPSRRTNRTNRAGQETASSSVSLLRGWAAHLLAVLGVLLLCSVVRASSPAPLGGIKYSRAVPPPGDDKDDDSFRPIIPTGISREYISRNVFTKSGQYRVFEPVESDLRAAVSMKRQIDDRQTIKRHSEAAAEAEATRKQAATARFQMRRAGGNEGASVKDQSTVGRHRALPAANSSQALEDLLVEYVENFFGKGQYEPTPGLLFELQKNRTDGQLRVRRHGPFGRRNAAGLHVDKRSAITSGRLLSFAGLKKILWPIFTGFQILKSLLVAMILPTLIGSLQGLFAKGLLNSGQLSIRPMDSPIETTFNFDDDAKFNANADVSMHQQAASQVQNQYAINGQPLSRYGMTEQQQKMQDSYLSALQSIGAGSFQTSTSLSSGSSGAFGRPAALAKPAAAANMNTFQTFQKVPDSSLLLSNYDPFYSPLLSRLDSVFAQLKLNSADEACREKLICLMYAYPAKYAPYSNLVSAQLSRELNELRKPTSDNPDILRFFRYMRAAKDGQDGVDCEKSFEKCTEFKDFENPAMVSTYNDINKLVQARKLT